MDISDMVKAALDERHATRQQLAERIDELCVTLPRGAVLTSEPDEHNRTVTVRVVRVYCGCSQWANRTWDATGKARAVLVDDDLLLDVDPGFHDGSNMLYRRTPLYRSHDGGGSPLRLATSQSLRYLASRLGAMIAAYVATQQAEAAANRETLAAL